MLRITTLLALLALLHQPALGRASKSNIIVDRIAIPSFKAYAVTNNTIQFPPHSSLPPLLRSLKITKSDKGFTASGPYAPVDGIARFRPKNVVIINFKTPKIRVRLTAIRVSPDALTLRGTARHVFVRPFGVRLHRSRLSALAAIAAAEKAVRAAPYGLRVITVVDHAAAAKSVGLRLPSSTVIVFGNPAIGSKLWPSWPTVGIELPMEVLVASSPLGVVYVAWNAYSSLKERTGIIGVRADKVVREIDAIHAFVGSAAAKRKLKPASLRFDVKRIGGVLDGIAVASMKGDALSAYDRLVAALKAAPPVNIAFEFLHDELAEMVGAPTRGKVNRVVVFGNPSLGTGIMQRSFAAALDLPVKMNVWTTRRNAKKFTVGYTTAEWIGRRHRVEVPEMLSAALENFAAIALGM